METTTTTTTTTITVVGEALIDIVEGTPPTETPGGGPANIALGLGRLGIPVQFVTWLGNDERGHRIADHLAESGVELHQGVFDAARTATATVRVRADGQPEYEFDVEWDLPAVPETPAWLHIGSIGAFLQPGARKVRGLAERVATAGGIVSFDPNIRPQLMGDVGDARVVFEELAALTDVLKLSDEDAAWLYPGVSVDEVLRRLNDLGVAVAAVTLGANGSILASDTHRAYVPGLAVEVIDTIGAGDTYMAVLIRELAASGWHPTAPLCSDALAELGSSCACAAAITVIRSGADLPYAAELHAGAAQ